MMRMTVLLPIALLTAAAAPHLVPEGVHTLTKGPTTICEITASSPADFEAKIRIDAAYSDVGGDEKFRIYRRVEPFAQWVFSRREYFAYPMATCVTTKLNDDNTVSVVREMKCGDTRERCDRALLEFQALDQNAVRGR